MRLVFDLGAKLTAFGEYLDTKSFEKGLFVDTYFLAESFNCPFSVSIKMVLKIGRELCFPTTLSRVKSARLKFSRVQVAFIVVSLLYI